MIKRLFFLAVLFVASYGFVKAQEYPGANLVTSVQLGFSEPLELFNFAEHNDTLYIPSWESNEQVRFSMISKETVPGYPAVLDNAVGIHSFYVDNDGFIWAFDLDGSQINKYSPDNTYIESVAVGSQPISGTEIDGNLYVVDRGENKIYIVDMETYAISSFDVNIMNGGWKSDVFYYQDTLYLVSDQFNGVLKMNPDGSDQQLINMSIPYMGIFIRNDTLYLAGGDGIDVADMNGNIMNQIDVANPPVVDIHVKDDTLYTICSYQNEMLVYDLPSNQAEILSYTVPEATNVEFIDVGVATRIEVAVPEGTDLTNLTPTFSLSDGATAYNAQTMEEEVSGVNSHDFSTYAVGYIVEAEDGTQNTYAVYVYEEGVVYEMELISYTIPGQMSNEIDQENFIVDITVPQGTDLTSLIADFEVSYGASLMLMTNPETYEMIPQVSGETANDFTDTLTLTVFNHLMNDMNNYDIVVTIDPSNINTLTESESFVIYPNPVNEFVNITFTNENIHEISIYDMAGKMLVKQAANKQNKEQVNLSGLKSGIYTVKIQTTDEVFTTKIMKR